MECVRFVLKVVVTGAYRIFGFGTLHNFHLGTSKRFMQCTVTCVRLDDLHSHLGKPILERWSLSRMPTSILRNVNLILAMVERKSSLPGIQKEFSHRESSLELNGVFSNGGAGVMLEEKTNQLLTWYFQFCMATSIVWLHIESRQRGLKCMPCKAHWWVELCRVIKNEG